MSNTTMNTIDAIARLVAAVTAAVNEAGKAGLSASQVIAALEPITEALGNDEE